MPFGSVNFEFVCAKCFSDEALKDFVSGIATSKKCDFCGRTSSKRIAVPFEEVSERIADCIGHYYDDPGHANPMRLHQRVGRLNRYGQKRPVSVFLLRNPETVEARIWALLEDKLARIQVALSASMDEAEDISQLVVGMTGEGFFEEVFTEAPAQRAERLSDWFDTRTAQFGGRDAVATVRALVGNVARYDFQSVGAELPRVDLPALEPFFRNAMSLYGRRVTRSEPGFSVATPEAWRGGADLRDRYDGLLLDRSLSPGDAASRILGVGHALFDRALVQCAGLEPLVARLEGLPSPLVLTSVEDEITGTGATVHRVVVGGMLSDGGAVSILRDWELLNLLNELRPGHHHGHPLEQKEIGAAKLILNETLNKAGRLSLGFSRPRPIAALVLMPVSPNPPL